MHGTAAARAGASPARTLSGFDRSFVAGYGPGWPPPWLSFILAVFFCYVR